MLSLDLFDSRFEKRLQEGAVDNLEARRIDDLNMRMLDLLARAKEPAYKKNPAALAGLKKQFQKIKAERDSYFKINPATGMNDTGTLGTVKGALDELGIPGNVPVEKIPGKEDLLKGKGRSYYEDQKKSSDKIAEDQRLHVGDPVIVTAPNEFEGKTGEISEFSPSGKFVVVNLYNHGEHSMHLSDVEYNQYADEEVDEGWSDAVVARRTGTPRTPYSVYIKGKKWKDFENDDHAEAVANKLRAKFKADGRDPSVITIAPTDMLEGVAEGKAEYNFDAEDLKRLERIRDLPTLKTQALALISRPSAKPMKPEKVEWFKNALERMNSPIKVIKLMYDLLLSGEGHAVVGSKSSMNPNSYRQRFGEQGVAEAGSPAQQAAIAIAMKKAGKKPKSVDETALNPRDPAGDYAAKRKALHNLSLNKDVDQQAVQQRRLDLDREARAKGIAETVSDVRAGMAQIYRKLAPKIERHRDSFLAGQLYDELENYAELHGAEGEFKRMMNGARNRAHMEYDTNPGGFHNWFWFLPFEDQDMAEEKQKGVDGKACWDGYKRMGTKKKGDKTVDNCVKMGEDQVSEDYSDSSDAVERAILNRIMVAHTDLLKQYGPQKVMQAAEEVAYDVGDVDEIGTSDVSAYVNQVKQILGAVQEGLKDPADNPCWKGYKPVGTKQKGGRTVPNCVPKE
jgi:hypothetical protein